MIPITDRLIKLHLSYLRLLSLFSTLLVCCLFNNAYTQKNGDIGNSYILARPDVEFKIFQFPRDQMPRIDGDTSDWQIFPEEYVIGTDQLRDTEDGMGADIDPDDLDVKVKVGWVKGLNRLYFLYEAYDDFWDFGRFNPQGYLNDIFEVVIDGDLSGGPFITNPNMSGAEVWGDNPEHIANHFAFSGIHAQNYHIFTPPVNNTWVLVWGCQPWIGEFPYANYAYQFDFQHGQSGKLILEFWITPFDYAPYGGPEDAKETTLQEDNYIGLSWSVLDFDGGKREGHCNLSHNTKMVKDASYLCKFRLMPMEDQFLAPIRAEWSFQIVDMKHRKVAFKDESIGDISAWKWDFGDGTTSNEKNPIHVFHQPGVHKVVTLEVSGPAGISRRTRYWEVMIK